MMKTRFEKTEYFDDVVTLTPDELEKGYSGCGDYLVAADGDAIKQLKRIDSARDREEWVSDKMVMERTGLSKVTRNFNRPTYGGYHLTGKSLIAFGELREEAKEKAKRERNAEIQAFLDANKGLDIYWAEGSCCELMSFNKVEVLCE